MNKKQAHKIKNKIVMIHFIAMMLDFKVLEKMKQQLKITIQKIFNKFKFIKINNNKLMKCNKNNKKETILMI